MQILNANKIDLSVRIRSTMLNDVRPTYIGLGREVLAKRRENQSRLHQTKGTLSLHTFANFFCLFVFASSSGAPLSNATPISNSHHKANFKQASLQRRI